MPVVQTKAKLNSLVSRGPTSDFGMSSMFGSSSRKRQNVTDEDAPPTNSVNDIPNEIFADSPSRPPRNQTMASFDSSLRRHQHAPSAPQQSQHVYIIVFGYPPDKYTQTVDFFKSLGNSTEADLNLEVANCFKIGYKDLGDAMRAVRKNGDILGGSWMIGVKWADPSQSEALIGQPIPRGSTIQQAGADLSQSPSNAMAVDDGPSNLATTSSTLPLVGTPIRLAPSSSAFRKPGTVEKRTPQRSVVTSGYASAMGTPVAGASVSAQPTPSKGVIGQVSDLIFGW
ncbi:hypothetical protein HGRIS_005303 [Hohenbuehelia grisea]